MSFDKSITTDESEKHERIESANADADPDELIGDATDIDFDDGETTRVNAKGIPKWRKAAVKSKPHVTITDAIKDGIRLNTSDDKHGTKIDLLRDQKGDLADEKINLRAEREKIDRRIVEIEREQDEIDAAIEQIESNREQERKQYDELLTKFEQELAAGKRVLPDMSTFQRAVEYSGGKSTDEVRADIQKRILQKHGVDVPDRAFKSAFKTDDWRGFEMSDDTDETRAGENATAGSD